MALTLTLFYLMMHLNCFYSTLDRLLVLQSCGDSRMTKTLIFYLSDWTIDVTRGAMCDYISYNWIPCSPQGALRSRIAPLKQHLLFLCFQFNFMTVTHIAFNSIIYHCLKPKFINTFSMIVNLHLSNKRVYCMFAFVLKKILYPTFNVVVLVDKNWFSRIYEKIAII